MSPRVKPPTLPRQQLKYGLLALKSSWRIRLDIQKLRLTHPSYFSAWFPRSFLHPQPTPTRAPNLPTIPKNLTMARLTPSITATLGIALLALLSNSPTGTHAANTSMSKPASQQCIQCLDTSLPACGKMRPTDPTYATCLCGDTSSFSTTEAFLPCAKLCVQHEVLEPAVATHQSFMSYCSMMFPKGWCEDSNNPSIGSYWGVSCATGGTMIMVGPDNL